MAKFIIGLVLIWFSLNSTAQDVKTYIPINAYKHLPVVKQEQIKIWPDHSKPESIPALIEHESCLSLKHSRCWNPQSRLKTQREEGAGLGQITRAYRADGTIRFDALTDLRKRHLSELRELNWDNVYSRPDLQISALLLLSKDNYKALYNIKDPNARLHFNDAAYNGGLGGVNSDRRLCGLKANCDPQLWFNHVEKTCTKSKEPLYAGRSACDINRHHVHDVFNNRSDKYKPFMK